MLNLHLAVAIAAAATAAAAPVASGADSGVSTAAGFVKAVEATAPNATCARAGASAECRTAAQAAPFIAASLRQFGFGCSAEAASVTALQAFESADFGFKHNMSPGRAGQGTANMQMARFNLLYAKALPAVRGQVAGLASVDGQSNDTLNRILALVTADDFNFGSGAWFLRTQCPPDVADRLRRDPDEGFGAHMACVGVDVTPERKAYFDRAKDAFGLAPGRCGSIPDVPKTAC